MSYRIFCFYFFRFIPTDRTNFELAGVCTPATTYLILKLVDSVPTINELTTNWFCV